jgi:hypothetical protein
VVLRKRNAARVSVWKETARMRFRAPRPDPEHKGEPCPFLKDVPASSSPVPRSNPEPRKGQFSENKTREKREKKGKTPSKGRTTHLAWFSEKFFPGANRA